MAAVNFFGNLKKRFEKSFRGELSPMEKLAQLSDDLETKIVETKKVAASSIAQLKALERRVLDCEAEIQQLESKARTALEQAQTNPDRAQELEEQARSFLYSKRDSQDHLEHLRLDLDDQKDQVEQLKLQIKDLQRYREQVLAEQKNLSHNTMLEEQKARIKELLAKGEQLKLPYSEP